MAIYQQTIIDNKLPLKDKIKEVSIVKDYYKNIIYPFASACFELPKEYNASNSGLDKIINIIVHIVKRVMIVNLYGLILKSMTKYIITVYPNTTEKERQEMIIKIIVGIIDNKDKSPKKSDLLDYMFNVLPLKLVKVVLQIYEGPDEGEGDPDKDVSLISLLEHINKILNNNTTFELPEDASLLTNLKDHIFPYFAEYFELFIKEMYNLMLNYLRTSVYHYNSLELLEKMSTSN